MQTFQSGDLKFSQEHLVHRSLSANDLEKFKPLQHDLNCGTLSILSTNSKLKITLYNIINRTTAEY